MLVGSSDRLLLLLSGRLHLTVVQVARQGAGFRAVTSVWAFNGIYLESVSGNVRCSVETAAWCKRKAKSH